MIFAYRRQIAQITICRFLWHFDSLFLLSRRFFISVYTFLQRERGTNNACARGQMKCDMRNDVFLVKFLCALLSVWAAIINFCLDSSHFIDKIKNWKINEEKKNGSLNIVVSIVLLTKSILTFFLFFSSIGFRNSPDCNRFCDFSLSCSSSNCIVPILFSFLIYFFACFNSSETERRLFCFIWIRKKYFFFCFYRSLCIFVW